MDIDFLKYIPEQYKIDFLMGYFDGDGGVSTAENRAYINIACNKSLSRSIQTLLSKYNIGCNAVGRDSIDVIYISNREDVLRFTQIYLYKNQIYPVMSRKIHKLTYDSLLD